MSKQTSYPKYLVDGVEIDAISIDAATRYIVQVASEPSTHACYVAKPYVEFFAAREDPRVRGLLNQAELCLPDGVSLNWATTFLYGTHHHWWDVVATGAQLVFRPKAAYAFLPDRFAGPNVTWPLLERCEQANLRVLLMGSPKHGSIIETANVIRRHLPNITIVGALKGEIGGLRGAELLEGLRAGISIETVAEEIRSHKPDVILVGMGFPLQETLMAQLQGLLSHGVMIGEGGTFDYQSFGGQAARAPQFMQKLGIEWLWRLIREPSRIRRQIEIPRFIWRIYRSSHR